VLRVEGEGELAPGDLEVLASPEIQSPKATDLLAHEKPAALLG
jgi:hypothetical protein